MQEARAAPLPFCPLQAPQHEASRDPTGSFQRSMLEEAAGFLPLGREHPPAPRWHLAQEPFPAMARRCGAWGAVTALAESLGKRPQGWSQPRAVPGSSRGTRAAVGGSVPAMGQGQGATAQGRASPAPGNFSLSSWMSALAVIKIKSIFFCCKKKKKRHCSGEHFPPSQLLCLCDRQGEANGILGLQGTSGASFHSGRGLVLNFQIVFSFLC